MLIHERFQTFLIVTTLHTHTHFKKRTKTLHLKTLFCHTLGKTRAASRRPDGERPNPKYQRGAEGESLHFFLGWSKKRSSICLLLFQRALPLGLQPAVFSGRPKGKYWLLSAPLHENKLALASPPSVFCLLLADFLGCAAGSRQEVTCWREQSGLTSTETEGQSGILSLACSPPFIQTAKEGRTFRFQSSASFVLLGRLPVGQTSLILSILPFSDGCSLRAARAASNRLRVAEIITRALMTSSWLLGDCWRLPWWHVADCIFSCTFKFRFLYLQITPWRLELSLAFTGHFHFAE